jgi:hypothetical protein
VLTEGFVKILDFRKFLKNPISKVYATIPVLLGVLTEFWKIVIEA